MTIRLSLSIESPFSVLFPIAGGLRRSSRRSPFRRKKSLHLKSSVATSASGRTQNTHRQYTHVQKTANRTEWESKGKWGGKSGKKKTETHRSRAMIATLQHQKHQNRLAVDTLSLQSLSSPSRFTNFSALATLSRRLSSASSISQSTIASSRASSAVPNPACPGFGASEAAQRVLRPRPRSGKPARRGASTSSPPRTSRAEAGSPSRFGPRPGLGPPEG